MSRRLSSAVLAAMLGLGLGACTVAAAKETWTLGAGTLIEARLRDSLATRGKNAADALTATVAADVTNERGQVVIPAGSIVGLRIAQYGLIVKRANNKYPLDAASVTIRGQVYPVNAKVEPVAAPGMEAAVYRPNPAVLVMPGTLILFSLERPLTVPARYP